MPAVLPPNQILKTILLWWYTSGGNDRRAAQDPSSTHSGDGSWTRRTRGNMQPKSAMQGGKRRTTKRNQPARSHYFAPPNACLVASPKIGADGKAHPRGRSSDALGHRCPSLKGGIWGEPAVNVSSFPRHNMPTPDTEHPLRQNAHAYHLVRRRPKTARRCASMATQPTKRHNSRERHANRRHMPRMQTMRYVNSLR